MKRPDSLNSGVVEIDPLADGRWDRFVERHPFGWLCHHSGWKEVLEGSFRHMKGHYLALIRGGRIEAGLPVFEVRSWLTGNRLVSVPFATIFDPLVSSHDDLSALTSAAVEFARERNIGRIEIRTLRSSRFFSKTDMGVAERYKHHYLPLDRPPEELMKTFHRTCVRQRIAKAFKCGLEVAEGKTEEDLRDFYGLYVRSRKRLALPPQPYAFIESIYKVFYRQGRVSILIGKKKGKPVAALLLLKFKGRVSAEFAVYDEAYLNTSPIHGVFWEAIKSAAQEGFSVFDFGRTSASNVDLMDFKDRWGTSTADMSEFHYPASGIDGGNAAREDGFGYRLVRAACRKAPAFALKHIGSLCYRHLG